MKRTQLQLEDPLYEALRAKAYGAKRSVAFIVREALNAYLRPELKRAHRPDISRLSYIGSCKGRQGKLRPVSERHDEALAEAFRH